MTDVETPHGTARLHHRDVPGARGLLVLGHSAGGGVTDPALIAAADGAARQRVSTVLVEQPYRVAGRRMPPPAGHVDAALLAVLTHVRVERPGLPVVSGGRSFGGRVACRTSAEAGVVGVLCLAFPLLPPGRRTPPPSRLPELDAVAVPALVVQGDTDEFGVPPTAPGRTLVVLAGGDHSLRRHLPAVRDAVDAWLGERLSDPGATVGA